MRTKKITVLLLVALLAIGITACGMNDNNGRDLTRGYDNNQNLTRGYDNGDLTRGNRDLTRGYDNPNMLDGRDGRFYPYTYPYNGAPNGTQYNGYNDRDDNNFGPNRYRTNRFRANANGDAERMADLAANVKGVDDATVVIAGGTAYVGLDLDDKVTSQNAEGVERKVYNTIKKMAATRYNVSITSDADMFGRLRDVGDGIRGGSPLNQFDNDLRDFDNRFRTFTR